MILLHYNVVLSQTCLSCAALVMIFNEFHYVYILYTVCDCIVQCTVDDGKKLLKIRDAQLWQAIKIKLFNYAHLMQSLKVLAQWMWTLAWITVVSALVVHKTNFYKLKKWYGSLTSTSASSTQDNNSHSNFTIGET